MRLLVLVLASVLMSCAVTADRGKWAFVQSVGGLSLSEPRQTESGWVLPVNIDVSGLVTNTIAPTQLNSALACEQTTAEVSGTQITLTIITSIARRGFSTKCPPALLGKINPGHYSVFYRGPNEEPQQLGEVAIGL